MAATTKTTTTKKKRKKKRKNDFDDDITNVSSEKETTKKKRKRASDDDDDVGELLVKMYPHGSFIRPLFVHRQTQKDIRDIREEEDIEDEDKEEKKAAASSASFAAATVLVTGFPFDWHNEFSIQDLFSTSFGETKRVQLIRLKTNSEAKSALVTFEQTKSLQKLWKKIEEKTIVEAPMTTRLGIGSPPPPQFGLDKFVHEHRLRRKGGAKAAKATVDEWFRNRAKEKEIEKRKRAREEEDDGWTVVQQKRGRRKTSDNQGITVGGVRASTVERRRKEALTREDEDGDTTTTSSSFYRKKKMKA